MKPAARITINGKDISAKLLGPDAVLVSLTVSDEAGVKSDTVELEIDNSRGFPAPPIDGEIQVWLGYEPEPKYMGRYKVESWTKRGPPNMMTVSAKAPDMTGEIKSHRLRSHHDTTVGAIVKKIAAEHNLQAVVDSELAAREIPHIDQQSESNLNFLTRLAKRQGATFKLGDGKIIFAKKGSRKKPNGQDKPTIKLTPADVADWSITHGERGGFSSSSTTYMDRNSGQRVTVTSGKGKPRHREKKLYGSLAEAKAAASASLGDLTRGKKSGDLSMAGNPALFAESIVSLSGFDDDADGEYLAKSVRHTLDGSGYRTTVTLGGIDDADTESGSDDTPT